MELPPKQVLKGRKGEMEMKTLAMNDHRLFNRDEEGSRQEILQTKSSSWWQRFFGKINASFEAPFKSEWDNKCGLHWREWGKL